jgi:hypothetical protein
MDVINPSTCTIKAQNKEGNVRVRERERERKRERVRE